jgi:hypothetical protein
MPDFYQQYFMVLITTIAPQMKNVIAVRALQISERLAFMASPIVMVCSF